MYQVFTLSQVIERHRKLREPWLEFLRLPTLSLGIYGLPTGAEDPQLSHAEDEVYHVVAGRAMLRIENEDHVVEPGSILFVGANVKHYFHGIQEALTSLVFFSSSAASESKK